MSTEKSKINAQTKHIPKDAQVIMSILKELNLENYEPRVINQLLDFVYRYVTCILDDAKIYANHARKKTIDLDDVRLAIEVNKEKSFTGPPPRQELSKLAEAVNNKPLPPVKPLSGLRLPPDRYCLLSCNYKMRTTTAPRKVAKAAAGEGRTTQKSVIKSTGSGAAKRQQPTSKAQVANAPKPVIKFSSTAKPTQVSLADVKMEPGADEAHVGSETVGNMTSDAASDIGIETQTIMDSMSVGHRGGLKREHQDDDDFEIVQ